MFSICSATANQDDVSSVTIVSRQEMSFVQRLCDSKPSFLTYFSYCVQFISGIALEVLLPQQQIDVLKSFQFKFGSQKSVLCFFSPLLGEGCSVEKHKAHQLSIHFLKSIQDMGRGKHTNEMQLNCVGKLITKLPSFLRTHTFFLLSRTPQHLGQAVIKSFLHLPVQEQEDDVQVLMAWLCVIKTLRSFIAKLPE